MKKIMFSDRLGLTQAVLDGRKTMTRRLVKDANLLQWLHEMEVAEYAIKGTILDEYIKYKVGEVVAVAQPYKDIIGERVWLKSYVTGTSIHRNIAKKDRGWNNKLFAASEFMPHRIRITDIKVERLKYISSEDCLKEGIEARIVGCHTFYYIDGVEKPFEFPKHAFGALIDKVSGKGTWGRNPWVFVYEFELVKGGGK